MMETIEIESLLKKFKSNDQPCKQQTTNNNFKVLQKKRTHFYNELRYLTRILGFVILVIVYFKDISIIRLSIRSLTHCAIARPYSSSKLGISLTETNKKVLSKFLMYLILITNVTSTFIYLFFGSYKQKVYFDKKLHGGLSIQFIGDRLPFFKFEIVFYDFFFFLVQVLFHALMCTIDQINETSIKDENQMKFNKETDFYKAKMVFDGSNGKIVLFKLNILEYIKNVLKYNEKFQFSSISSLFESRVFVF